MLKTPKFKLKNSKPEQDFIEWNKSMSHHFDQDNYYYKSHPFIVWVENLRLKAISKIIKSHIDINKNTNPMILEVGCGAGHVLEEIVNSIPEVVLTGLDPLQEWLDKAKKRLGNKSVKLINGLGENLPFEDKSMDCTICTEVLEHVLDPKAILKELSRVTKHNGLVVVSIPNEVLINRLKNLIDAFKIYEKLFPNIQKHNDWHIHCFDIESFKEIIPEGLKIKSIYSIPFLLLPLRYVITFKV